MADTEKFEPRWLDRGRGAVVLPDMALCLSEKEFADTMLYCDNEPWENDWCSPGGAVVWHFKGNHGQPTCIVCMRDWEQHELSTILAMLVHEAVHIKQHYMRHIGEAEPSVEFEAYCTQWISLVLMDEFLWRLKNG